MLFVFVALTATVIVTLAILNKYKTRKINPGSAPNNSDSLFDELLGKLELSVDDRNLLHEMTEGARLRHPTLCLLSPDLLEWARQLWLQEKGPDCVTNQKTTQLDAIAVKLYDHRAGDAIVSN